MQSIANYRTQELVQSLLDSKKSLAELAPHGEDAAQAIADTYRHADLVRRELERRTDAQIVKYFNGNEQVVLKGSFPKLGAVSTYSDGRSDTTVNLY